MRFLKYQALLVPLLLVAVGLIVVGCSGDEEPDELQSVTFMLDWTPNTNHAGIFVAKAKGWYEEAGLDVEIIEPGAGGVDQTVASGTAHFGISVAESVIPARQQGIPVISIAAVIEHNTSSLIALEEENIAEPGDLAGKTYGGWGGALETALISRLVECDGGDPSAVDYAIIGNVDYIVGMEQDDYDFVWIFDAWDGIRYTEVLGKKVSFISFIDHTDCIPDWYTPVIITSESLIEDDPKLVRSFMAATARGYRYAMENPQEAAQILLEAAPELDKALVEASATYLATRYTSDADKWGWQELKIWTAFESFLHEAGLTESAIDVEKAFTNNFLP
ncbi:MAG: myristoyl transferase [Dehalococcoidia bacterium]|nr:myristoyl transferase [Dehalococcoidia bacterium]HCU99750.1 myristoyl transferase [Dehalococcoidia bacterium]|tara:strand:+ start:818 stop:1819 length:1002 start_codon:yes stop_codon:yes gene_type:complete